MGFELLPIEDGDEDRYDIFTITSPAKWIPKNFLDVNTSIVGEGKTEQIPVDKGIEGREVTKAEKDPGVPVVHDEVNSGKDISKTQVPEITSSKGKLKLNKGLADLDDSTHHLTRSKKQPGKDVRYQKAPNLGEANSAKLMQVRPRGSGRLNRMTWGLSKDKMADLLTKPLGKAFFERLASKYLAGRLKTVTQRGAKDDCRPP